MPPQIIDPSFAVNYLVEMSVDVHAAALTDCDGQVIAATPTVFEGGQGALKDLIKLARSDQIGQHDGLEILTAEGQLFLLLGRDQALIALAQRTPIPALVLFDMRTLLHDLERDGQLDRGPT